MFWIFIALGSLMMFAMTVGKLSVWVSLLKTALLVALLIIAMMGIASMFRRLKGDL